LSGLEINAELVSKLKFIDVILEEFLGLLLTYEVPFTFKVSRLGPKHAQKRIHDFAGNDHQILGGLSIVLQQLDSKLIVIVFELWIVGASRLKE
jgi:hypothetical protein